jgi:predicted transcriptional regulator
MHDVTGVRYKRNIIRASKDQGNFTQIMNMTIRNEWLSAEARMVLIYLLSRSDYWRLNIKDIRRQFRWGKDKVYRIINELMKAGYIIRQVRKSAVGRFEAYDYLIIEEPASDAKKNMQETQIWQAFLVFRIRKMRPLLKM